MPAQDPTETREIVDAPFQWRDRAWRGLPRHYAVVQQIDVSSYTPAGTFAALAAKIPHLADLGITALQLMPLGAPDASFGRPEQLKALIDKAHDYGLMVYLDVASEHLALEHALMRLQEFHLDGLRVGEALREELTPAARDRFPHRQIHLFADESANDALHRVLTGEPMGDVRKLLPALLPIDGLIGKRERDTDGRLVSLGLPEAARAVSAIQLLHPQVPLLIMGEEWEADETFGSAKLDWSALRQPDGAAAFERYQKLISIRRNEISPRLPAIVRVGRGEMTGEHSFRIEWTVGDAELLVLEANLSAQAGPLARKDVRRVLWVENDCAPGRPMPPWSVLWTLRRTG